MIIHKNCTVECSLTSKVVKTGEVCVCQEIPRELGGEPSAQTVMVAT